MNRENLPSRLPPSPDNRLPPPLAQEIDKLLACHPAVLVALEGPSAGGKTSLAALLQTIYGCNVLAMDDFFLRPRQRTPQRLAEPGGNVDYRRFAREVLGPLAAGEVFSYRPYSCKTQRLGPPVLVTPTRLTVVEGAYSTHPFFREPYHLKVFLAVEGDEQLRRILARNGPEQYTRFVEEWLPLERRYFEACHTAEHCDLILD